MDTPGTMDQDQQAIQEEIFEAIAECDNGYDAILIVCKWVYIGTIKKSFIKYIFKFAHTTDQKLKKYGTCFSLISLNP